jgi:hypothetical protein
MGDSTVRCSAGTAWRLMLASSRLPPARRMGVAEASSVVESKKVTG